MEIIDPTLEGDFNRKEAVRMIKVALVCSNSSPSLRPTMSEAVQMLEGEIEITQVMSDPDSYGHTWSISERRDMGTHGNSGTSNGKMNSSVSGCDIYPLDSESVIQTRTTVKSSVSGCALYPLYPESVIQTSTVELSSSSL